MDTKLKKFDRLKITKTIAFLLAMLFTALSVVKTLAVFEDLSKNHVNNTYYRNILSQGKNFDLTTSEMFYAELKNFSQTATKNALIYQNGEKKAFEQYKENVSEFKKKYSAEIKQNLKKTLLKESNKACRYSTFSRIEQGDIKLEKVAGHKDHSFCDGTFYYESGESFFRDSQGTETEIYNDDFILADHTEELNNVMNAYDEYDNLIYSFKTPSDIPNSILEKAKNCDGVLELCRTQIGGKKYDGYYKYTISDAYVFEELKNSSYTDANYTPLLYDEYFESYEDFKDNANENAKELARYKNMTFAFIDNSTKKVVAATVPGISKNMSADKAQKIYLKNSWFISHNFQVNKTDYGSAVKNSSDILQFLLMDYLIQYQSPYTLVVCFDTSLANIDMFNDIINIYNNVYYSLRADAITVLVYLLTVLLCVIYLVIRSGRKHGDREIHMIWSDKIFILTRTAITCGLISSFIGIFFAVYDTFYDKNSNQSVVVTVAVLCALTVLALLIDWLCFIARNIKNHTFFKNNFVYWIVNNFKNDYRKYKAKLAARPPVYKDIFNDVMRKVTFGIFTPNILIGLSIFLLICAEAFLLGILLLIVLFVYDLFALFYIIRYAYAFRKILYALNQIRHGNYDVTIDKNSMPQTVKAYASDVEALKEGLVLAVENAVKEQKTKTELITNVSHDLKTPLTSIINYVDLLSRCDIKDEDAKGYIEVLGDKSARLKRLIEDLVEASKASTGNVQVHYVNVSLKELTAQITGEYEDELEAKNLKLVLTVPNEDIIVRADSRMSYRILDNLLSNVKKYAMPNTRVYVDVEKENGKGIIKVRNISESPLNIAPEELTARFVRGDASRSTEGSGLGLSIAENFARLQGGKLTLEINGDMFTAKVEYTLA